MAIETRAGVVQGAVGGMADISAKDVLVVSRPLRSPFERDWQDEQS